MGLFSGLKNANGKFDLGKIGQAAGNMRSMLSDDDEERMRTMRAMLAQRQQAQPTQPQGLNTAITPDQYAIPASRQQPMVSPQELEMMRQGRSRGWHGGWNPPWAVSLTGGRTY